MSASAHSGGSATLLVARKSSIVVDRDDVEAAVVSIKEPSVAVPQEPKVMQWSPFAAFLGSGEFEHALRGRLTLV